MPTWWLSLLTTLVASIVFGHLARRFARKLGFLDRPGSEAHKQQPRSVPYGGGAAMIIALCLGWVVAFVCGDLDGATLQREGSLIAGAAALFLLGLVDDLAHLPARPKLLVQILIVISSLYPAHLRIESMGFLPGLDIAAAVCWCLLVTNAYNLLDHADGLSTTVALTSCLVLLAAALFSTDLAMALQIGMLMACLLGFLWWNRPPARLYMGDAGALPLGFLLGVGALQVTFWESGSGTGSQLAVLSPLLVTAIPLYDTAVVVVKRLRRRRPLMVGDRNHISHRLRRLGLGARSSLIVVGALQAAIAGSALLLRELPFVAGLILLCQACCILTVAILLEARRDAGE